MGEPRKRWGEASFDGVVQTMIGAAMNHPDVESVSEDTWPLRPKRFALRLADGCTLAVVVESDYGKGPGSGRSEDS